MGFKCEICGKELPTPHGLKVHSKRMHGVSIITPNIPAEESTVPEPTTAPVSSVTMKADDKVILNGRVWRQGTEPPFEWEEVEVKDVLVRVLGIEANPEGTLYAYAKAAGSKSLWSWRVVDFAIYALILEGMDVPPEMSREIDRQEFVPALIEYVCARDQKLAAETLFKKVSKNYRGTVEDFITKYGKESEEGKQDFVVYENGFKCQMARTPGREIISYDDEARMRWIMEDYENRKYLLKTIVDVGQWKLAEEEGRIPADVLVEVKNIKMTDDQFSLLVSVDKGGK